MRERRDLVVIVGVLAIIVAAVVAFYVLGLPTLDYILGPGNQSI